MTTLGSFPSLPEPGEPIPLGVPPPEGTNRVDPALVQQTKQEIRQLVQEITQLAQSDLDQREFLEGFLTRVVSALAAAGGAVWKVTDDAGLELAYQVNYPAQILNEDQAGRLRHNLLLRNVLQNGHATLVPPQSGAAAEDNAGNPTDFLLIFATLKVEQQTVAIIEVFQRAGGGPTTQRGYLRFLVQMADLANDYFKTRKLRHLGDRQTLWESLEQFIRVVHRGLDLQATAFTVVNESRPFLQCDRVSLGLRRGRKYTITAVSGMDSIDRRAVEVRLLGQLAGAVSAAGQPLWYDGTTADLPPQIAQPLDAYLDQAHSKLLGVVPLFAPRVEEAGDATKNDPPIAVLIAEKLGDNRMAEGLRERAEVVALHSATALANAAEHQSLFLLPLWKKLGKASWIVQARTLPKTVLVAAAIGLVVAALAIIPSDFDLPARGKLQPSIRHEIFAQIDGIVAEVPVRHEQFVDADQVLCRLTNNDLDVEISNLRGRQQATQERITNLQRSLLNDRRLSAADRNRLDGELLELRQVEESIQRELALLQRKQDQLVVRSDMPGQVVTWNVHDTLKRRPVEIGQALMTVVDPNGPWELELYMAERRMGHVTQALHDMPDGGLPVVFILASHPEHEFEGKVVEVHRLAELHGDEGNSVILRVAIDKDALPELRSDTSVTARVRCGSRSILYVWFHEMIETLQTKVLFWL